MIERTVEEMYRDDEAQRVPRGHLPERRQGGPVLQGLLVGGDDREHRAPGQEARHQAAPRRRREGHRAPTTSCSRSRRSSRSTRTSPTPPTPTTGRRSRARRASGSSTSARSSSGTTTTSRPAAAPSSGWPPASTCSAWSVAARERTGLGSPPMALRKVLGVETEYGILVRGAADANPIAASSVLINAYVERAGPAARRASRRSRRSAGTSRTSTPATTPAASPRRGRWRPRSRPTSSTPCSPTAPATTSTTPTRSCRRRSAPTRCRSCVWDRAAEVILQRSMVAARRTLPEGQELVVYKNNTDGKGNSYGCHENYLMDRQVPFGRIVAHVLPFFVTRQVFTRRRQGRHRGGRRRHRRRCRSSCRSGPTSSRRRSASRRRSSGRSSTPATSRTPTRRSTAGST